MSGQCLVECTPEKLVLLSVMAERIRMERCCGEGENGGEKGMRG